MARKPQPGASFSAPKVGPSFLVSQVGAHAAAGFAQLLAKRKLKVYHAGILRMLGRNPGLTQRALSSLMNIFPSQAVRLLDELERRGLIERTQTPGDRRSYRLRLTAKGAKTLTAIGKLTVQLEKDLFAGLAAAERDQLCALLERVVARQRITPGVHPAYKELGRKQRP